MLRVIVWYMRIFAGSRPAREFLDSAALNVLGPGATDFGDVLFGEPVTPRRGSAAHWSRVGACRGERRFPGQNRGGHHRIFAPPDGVKEPEPDAPARRGRDRASTFRGLALFSSSISTTSRPHGVAHHPQSGS